MDQQLAVHIKNLSKTFQKKTGGATIRESLYRMFKNKRAEELLALKNINLEIRKGETFGIIGANGSGKSTLLYTIMDAFRPDKGSIIETQGKMIRLALGMGVDQNLSARDNIYLNGSILGLSFKKIGEIFDDIIEFAGLEEFVDTPVKQFSNGMKARLNFSVAMNANADIILLDEFFGGVGDEDFKKKSDEAFRQRIVEGRTIIIVSHNMDTIRKYCGRVLWLHKGESQLIGSPQDVIPKYKASFKNKNKKNKKR